mmetsp:Transcript_97675/g.232510  ORF Transcript_97675/g.232510 Transcript_97675/m.232510 type:complete len:142 (+) Transcript_97675:69-494(+)
MGRLLRRGIVLPALAATVVYSLAFAGGWKPQQTRGHRSALAAQITPLGNQVLLEELDEAEETSGLLLAEGSKKKTRLRLGRVEALGAGRAEDKREPKLLEALEVGDTVLWEDFSNRKLEEDPDSKLFLVPIRSVKAKVNSK